MGKGAARDAAGLGVVARMHRELEYALSRGTAVLIVYRSQPRTRHCLATAPVRPIPSVGGSSRVPSRALIVPAPAGITLCGFAFGVLKGWLLGSLGCILGS